MSGWQELRAERNRRSVLRLTKALPLVFPRAVLSRALARPFVPPTPRLAIESYWGAHPIRADRLASTRSSQPSARWMDLAAGGPQERLAFHVLHATRAVFIFTCRLVWRLRNFRSSTSTGRMRRIGPTMRGTGLGWPDRSSAVPGWSMSIPSRAAAYRFE